jgi:hypothetical protein
MIIITSDAEGVFNVSSTSAIVRAYGYSGSAPSSFAAPECTGTGSSQLLLINLSPDTNATAIFSADASYSAWSLTPVRNASGLLDPFSPRVNLNGQLLPELVDGARAGAGADGDGGPAAFLDAIPVAAVHGEATEGQATVELTPLSISFFCYS